jgi:MFS family permease
MESVNNFKRNRRLVWLALLLIVVAAMAIVITPVWIIQPFKAQSERGLAVSYAMRRWSPVITILGLIAAISLSIWLWRGTRAWWRKAVLVLALLPLLATTWFARQNHFEWMFNPLPNASYAKVDDASFVTDKDVVMAVENNGDAAAYPIRFMAYHHLVQDTVGGTPIVATY